MKEYFRKILIFFLGLCMGIGIGMAIAYKNVYDEIPWYEEFEENTLEWNVIASDLIVLQNRVTVVHNRFKQAWIEFERMFPVLAEQ